MASNALPLKKWAAALLLLAFVAALMGPVVVNAQTGTLSVSPGSDSKSGLPGSSLSFVFTVANSGAADETVSISAGTSGLGSVAVAPSVVVPAGGSLPVNVAVNLSTDAVPGSSEAIFVTFTAGGWSQSVQVNVSVSFPPTVAPTTPPGAARPLVVVDGYYLDKDPIAVGDSFKLFLRLKNTGTLDANNLILSFLNESFLPQDTGGVVALGSLTSGNARDISQRFLASNALAGLGVGTVPVKLTYTDSNGQAYSETFSITLQMRVYSGAAVATPTPTQAQVFRPQLVIDAYQTDVSPLQPGSQFALKVNVKNLGNADARAVTLVLGGGATPDPSGTPQPGGVSGSGADLATFAPLGSSNLVYLGDLPAGANKESTAQLIVNVSANPGAYTFKLSFVYTDPKGARMVDDQVITLLVFSLPQVEVNFYRDPGPIFAGQPAQLPLQVVNLGRKQAVLGNLTVTTANVPVENNTSLVGPLDPGGFFTLDSMVIPLEPGELVLNVVINYNDDFNQPRQIEDTITLTVQEAMIIDPGMGEGGIPGEGAPLPVVEETFWQKVVRFFKGLFGLDSGVTNPGGLPVEMPIPSENMPPTDSKPIPAPSGGKGG